MTHQDFKHRALCGLLAAALSLGTVGCVTVPNAAPAAAMTPAERKMQADQTRFNETVMGGALQGAGIGALIGGLGVLATGGNKNDALKGAAAGAVVGGLIGANDGYHKAKLQQAKMNEVEALRSAAADVKRDNARLQSFIDSSNQVLAEGRQRLASLRADVSARRTSVAEAEAARQREQQNISTMQSTLAKAKETRTQYTTASAQFKGSPAQKRDLDAEISRMNAQVATLERNIADYSQALVASRA